MMSRKSFLLSLLMMSLSLGSLMLKVDAFSVVSSRQTVQQPRRLTTIVWNSDNSEEGGGELSEEKKLSLEEKMKAWEATEEEVKAATLGGVVPDRSDAFDVGLYIAFPLIVISGLLFAVFPFIMENIDTSAVGPPPTI